MIQGKTVLAVIPARGGSKGIPRKNIKKLCGKPLIAWTIEEGLKSKYIDKLIVSTEDEEIALLSRKYGAEVPFLRPKELSYDDTPGIEPIIHSIKWMEQNAGIEYNYICVLQCTSPFRKSEHIDEALETLAKKNGECIVSVCESEISPYWMKKIENGILKDFMNNVQFYARRQELPKIYRLNGAIYAGKTSFVLKNKSWYGDNTLPYVMQRHDSLDIDDMLDFKIAELLMEERIKNNGKPISI